MNIYILLRTKLSNILVIKTLLKKDRAKSLTGLCPVINLKTDFFYSYDKVNGNILYDQKINYSLKIIELA